MFCCLLSLGLLDLFFFQIHYSKLYHPGTAEKMPKEKCQDNFGVKYQFQKKVVIASSTMVSNFCSHILASLLTE